MKKRFGMLLLAIVLCFSACGKEEKETSNGRIESTKEVNVTEATKETEEPESTEAPVVFDYAVLAKQAEDMITAYVEALKAGDVEMILSMTKPDSDLYEDLSAIKNVEGTKEFLQAMFAGTCCYTEDTLADTERNIQYAVENKKYEVGITKIKLAMPEKRYFSDFIPNIMFEDGEIIPEDYTPASTEEALQVIKNVAKELPVTLQILTLTTPDESGKMYVKSGHYYFDFLFEYLSSSQLTEEYIINYVTESYKYLGGRIVNSPDGVYEEDDEIWKEILPMLEQKDMEGMFNYYITLTGKDLRDTVENSFVYGDVKNLTSEQQAYVDSYVNRIVFHHCDLTRESNMERDSELKYFVPVLDYDENIQAWLLENNVTEVKDVYNFEPDLCIKTMTHAYLAAALHAKDDQVPALIPAWSENTDESIEMPEEGSKTPDETPIQDEAPISEDTQVPETTPAPMAVREKSVEELEFENRFATYTSAEQMTEEDRKILEEVLLTCWKELDLETLKFYDADVTNHKNIEKVIAAVAKDPEVADTWKKIMGTLIYVEEEGVMLYKNLEYMACQYYTDCYLNDMDCPYNSVEEIGKQNALMLLDQYFEEAPYAYFWNGLNITYKTVDGKLKIDLDEFPGKTYYANLKYLCLDNAEEGEDDVYWGRLVFGLNAKFDEDFTRMEEGYIDLKTLLGGTMKEKVDVFENNVDKGTAEYRLYQKVAHFYSDEAMCQKIGEYFDENCALLLSDSIFKLYTPNIDLEKYRYAGEDGTEIIILDAHHIASFGALYYIFNVVYDMSDYGVLN